MVGETNIVRCAGCGKEMDGRLLLLVRRELIYRASGVLKRQTLQYCSEKCAQEHFWKLQMAYED